MLLTSALILGASLTFASSSALAAIDKAAALQLSQANDLVLRRLAFGLDRKDLGDSSLRADLAHWALAFEPGRFRMSYAQIRGVNDSPDLATEEFVSIGEIDHLVVWHPSLQRAQLHPLTDPSADREFLPWPNQCAYLAFVPAPAHGRPELGLSALLADDTSVLEPFLASDGTTHRLTAPECPGRGEVIAWLDLSESPVITRYRMKGWEFRSVSMSDAGSFRLPSAIVATTVGGWEAFDAVGEFPTDADVLRFDVTLGADGLPQFLLGDEVLAVLPPAGATLPEGTSVFDMRAVETPVASGATPSPASAVAAIERVSNVTDAAPTSLWMLMALGGLAVAGSLFLVSFSRLRD